MRYFITFSYDGSQYKGYQKQSRAKTIQSEIEKALKTINNNQPVSISASGRTDAGVHALNQKAHFDLDLDINEEKLKKAINSLIPDDIYIKELEVVSDNFHARFNAKAKEYLYKINMGPYD
ncbi:MAG TPA: tRNA pseudouridine(38-40) synthase TruA, partial [Patescibacteria group bacterium]|nr:tRNA pseudouridine(38-40) synthase TruA [Patescibacteria group bacterium]